MKKKSKGGLVYSTDPEKMNKINQGTGPAPSVELAPEQTTVRVSLDTKRRRGKTVTLLTGFQSSKETLKQLGKKLKSACGSGGTIHENEIEIQGDHRGKIEKILSGLNYKTKRL